MIKRTAFIVLTGLTPFTSAFGKANSRKCQRALKAVTASGALKTHMQDHEVEAVLIGSKQLGSGRHAEAVSGLVVLYEDGSTCIDSSIIKSPAKANGKREFSEDFASWSYNANHDVELRSNKGGLGGLTIEARIDPLPENFRLQHFYAPLSMKASPTEGDVDSTNSYQFLEDGTFFIVDQAFTDEQAIEASHVDPRAHGRYHIEGFKLELLFDDGHVEEKTIVADQTDESLIWIDGDAFVDQD